MMLSKALRPASILLLATFAAQQARPAAAQAPEARYRAFDARGRAVRLGDVVEALERADVLLIGETHDDAVAHLLEAELLRRADEKYSRAASRAVALSLEMFERDVQVVLDEYLGGLISERHFLSSSRPWPNYQTAYRPMVEYAKARGLAVVAANAPARYVSRVTAHGPGSLSALSAQARAWLPPLPFAPASAAYAAKFRGFMRSESPHAPGPHGAHGAASHLLEAQTLRDAAMAHAIAEHLKSRAGSLVVHVNGTFHSEGRLGVPEHIQGYRPQARLLVVTIRRGAGYPDFDPARHAGLGDFVILTDPESEARP